MAATRLIAMHIQKNRSVQQCLKDRTDYAENGEKTENGEWISGDAQEAYNNTLITIMKDLLNKYIEENQVAGMAIIKQSDVESVVNDFKNR